MKQFLYLAFILSSLSSCGEEGQSDAATVQPVITEQPPQPSNQPSKAQTPVLFVQWHYPDSVDGLKALEIRQKVENKIDAALRTKGQGQWFAGDLGPGGANMLYEVHSHEKALPIILEVLKKEGLEKETLIAQRIYTDAENWSYKVVYPKDYQGEFNDM
ncbi:hypothetical protein OCK74_19715 [Chitinophagaceae bacterium LB-8]|uniref:Uncharacterized protein n=1 Tax=Paraflavisolibacter caeni TaxID=2982496 RepID=A0A9X2XXJ2_9BACT|nr:hypothetical protein [Paraflavisolibacter caeni]MCU7551359.1 hypothetical protein [Paraflavisolibacter caeni]